MTDLELMFSALGERISKEITINKNSQGYNGCEDSAKKGGAVAGTARKHAEKEIGKPITTHEKPFKKHIKSVG